MSVAKSSSLISSSEYAPATPNLRYVDEWQDNIHSLEFSIQDTRTALEQHLHGLPESLLDQCRITLMCPFQSLQSLLSDSAPLSQIVHVHLYGMSEYFIDCTPLPKLAKLDVFGSGITLMMSSDLVLENFTCNCKFQVVDESKNPILISCKSADIDESAQPTLPSTILQAFNCRVLTKLLLQTQRNVIDLSSPLDTNQLKSIAIQLGSVHPIHISTTKQLRLHHLGVLVRSGSSDVRIDQSISSTSLELQNVTNLQWTCTELVRRLICDGYSIQKCLAVQDLPNLRELELAPDRIDPNERLPKFANVELLQLPVVSVQESATKDPCQDLDNITPLLEHMPHAKWIELHCRERRPLVRCKKLEVMAQHLDCTVSTLDERFGVILMVLRFPSDKFHQALQMRNTPR